jgi:hypothetical protein
MAAISANPCFCSEHGLKRFTSKKGRGFVKCGKGTCTLFLPEEDYKELLAAYETKVVQKFKPNKFPLCDCEETTRLWVSHSEKNPGRPYFRCQDVDEEDKCTFFQWADDLTKKKKKNKKKTSNNDSTFKERETRNLRKRIRVPDSSDEETMNNSQS